MTVYLVYDDYGIDDTPGFVVDKDNIVDTRERIRSHLLNPVDGNQLKIQIPKTCRRLFKDFEGLAGVECVCIEPRHIFSQRYHVVLPPWLTNELVVSLGYLQKNGVNETSVAEWREDLTGWLLYLLDPNLVKPGSWTEFCTALSTSPLLTNHIARLEEIKDRLVTVAQSFMPSHVALQFIAKIVTAQSAVDLLYYLWNEQVYEQLRVYTAAHNIAYPLPPRNEPAELIRELPPISVGQYKGGKKILTDLEGLVAEVLHAIQEKRLPAAQLAGLCSIENPTLFAYLKTCLEESSVSLATQELADVLGHHESDEAKSLLELVRQHLLSCPPLPPDVDTHTARAWIPGYLDYALRRFNLNQEPDEIVSLSFTEWVIKQQARISRSNLDWRCVSSSISKYLENHNNRVIVCMVDALGAAHSNQVLEILKSKLNLESITTDVDFLLAPYPTLTEIGKNAVLTGRPATETSGTVHDRLFQTYNNVLESQSLIHVIKSWNDRADLIDEKTRLLVYLENRIDDRLHGCASYSKLQKDIEVIITQLASEISKWITLTNRHGLDPIILITADHGLTYISNKVTALPDGIQQSSISDRALTFSYQPPSQNGYLYHQSGVKHFLIPLNRVRLQGQSPLTHGGLTPEELLIPFITLRKNIDAPSTLQITSQGEKAHAYQKGWQLELTLIASFPSHNIKLMAQAPFIGRAGPFGPVQHGDKINITLPIQSEISQEGLVQVGLIITFYRPDLNANEQQYVTLPIRFPPRMMDSDDDAEAFNDMFN